MALLDDIRTALRVTTEALDAEIEMLAESALYDMERAGVNPALLAVNDETGDLPNMFAKQAVTCWCKAHFGYDVSEAWRFEAAYDRILNALLNSAENIAAIEQEDVEPESESEPEPTPDPEPDPEPDAEPDQQDGGE